MTICGKIEIVNDEDVFKDENRVLRACLRATRGGSSTYVWRQLSREEKKIVGIDESKKIFWEEKSRKKKLCGEKKNFGAPVGTIFLSGKICVLGSARWGRKSMAEIDN